MARLDRAIHESGKNLSSLLDGRVKPGHDNRSKWTAIPLSRKFI
jgi:hypothetical protein